MPKTRAQKIETVVKLQEKLGRAKAVVLADYKGLSMKQLSELRGKLSEHNAEFTITKNALLKLSLPTTSPFGDPQLSTNLDGPTATLFAYDDQITPIKILVKTLKDTNIGKIKLGFLGTDALDETRIQYLASLPTKDELRSQTVGVLVAPLQGMVLVLNRNLAKLVYALDQIRIARGGE